MKRILLVMVIVLNSLLLFYGTASGPCPTPGMPSGDPTPSNGFTGISTRPTLSWSPCINTNSYDVYFGTTKNQLLAVYNTSGTNYATPQLNINTTYYWKIVAKNTCGNSTSGPVWSFTTGIAPCATPVTPSNSKPANGAMGITTGTLLSWAPCANTNFYDVYFGTTTNPPLVVYKTSNTSYTTPQLNINTTYYWKVVAKNKCANSTSGPLWSFTTGAAPCPTPGMPSTPSPSNGITVILNTTTLSWSPCVNANSYDVYFGTDPNPPLKGSTTGTSYFVTGVSGTTYYWKIVAKNICGTLTQGPVWSFTTTPCPTPGIPSTPTPVNGATGISNSPTLSWVPAGITNYFSIYFGTETNLSSPVAQTTAINYLMSGLINSTTYYWKIEARNTCGTSTQGPLWSFTTGVVPCATPRMPSTPTPANGATRISNSPTLSWASCANADSYDFYFGWEMNPPKVRNFTGTSTPMSLQGNTTYYWKIVAKNSCGDSTSGPVWSFTTEPCPTPVTPSNPTPANGAMGISTRPTLSWAPSANYYELYFGTETNPTSLLSTTGHTSLPMTPLNINTTYYWRVVAKNTCGTSTQGPVWNFTTGSTPSPPMITTNTPLPSGTVGAAYSQTLQAAGGNTPYSWSITSGSLPAGLSLNNSTGVISGTPTMANTYNFRVRVTGSNALYSERDFSLTINPAPLGISVVFPNGGEMWAAGTTQTIRWSYAGNVGTFVKVELLKAGIVSRTITLLASIGSGGNGSYNWTIPSDQSPGTDYRIQVTSISSSAYTDTSDNNFTIE